MKTRFYTLLISFCIVSQMHAEYNVTNTDECSKANNTEQSCIADSATNVKAQINTNGNEDIKALSQRVDSLEHELQYLKLSFEWEKLSSSISAKKSEYNIQSNNIQINLFNRNFDYRLYQSYTRNYEACVDDLAASERLLDIMTVNLAFYTVQNHFTESEMDMLNKQHNLAKSALNAAKSSLDFYKEALKIYGKYV